MANVKIQGNVSGTGSLTIAAPNTNTDRTLTLPDESGTLLSSASPVIAQNGVPAFSAYSNSNQNLTTGVWTKLQINTEEFDTAGCYDTSNYRFTPTTAGYYQIIGGSNFSANSTNSRFLDVYKNGSAYKVLQVTVPNSINYMDLNGSCIVYMNGSTDYVELYAMQNSGSTLVTSASLSEVYFQGVLVRAA